MAELLTIETNGEAASAERAAPHALWRRGFRPFFLAGSLYGAFAVTLWTAMWRGWMRPPDWLAPPWWHGHEMLFGFVAAAIAGFLTTAAPVWTGRPAPAGRPLMALVALWALGRVAMLAAGMLPAWLVAAVDAAFLPMVALVLARVVWRTGQYRNYGVVALVGVLALGNVAVHAQALGVAAASAPLALRFTIDVVIVLVVVIGGRITPAFTANAFLRSGIAAPIRAWRSLDRAAVAATVLVAASDLVAPRSIVSGMVAAAAALIVGARVAGWQSVRTWRDPLVWSLHAGMLWVPLGFALVAASDLGAAVPATAGLHALTSGAMGAMIIAVVTRVSLGHTGRPLLLPKGSALSYVLVHAGAIARVAAALVPSAPALLWAGALLWGGAFALFAVLHAQILLRPRVDGKPG